MQDRVALNPGRVLVTPEDGSAAFYATLERADNPTQVGTALSKANLLKDTTAAQFGLDSSAVPDDVLAWVGKYNEYWWSLLHGEAYSYYIEKLSEMSSPGTICLGGVSDWSTTYSYEIEISDTGEVSLKNPQDLTLNSYSSSSAKSRAQEIAELSAEKPVYMLIEYYTGTTKYLVKIPVGATGPTDSISSGTFIAKNQYDSKYQVCLNVSGGSPAPLSVSSERIDIPAGETTYEHSPDRNAYPDSGTVDGITYTYLGCPFEKLPGAVQMVVGSYTGAGVYGSNNYNRLDFDFAPKLLMVRNNNHSYGGDLTVNSFTSDTYNNSIIVDTTEFQVTDDFSANTPYTNYVKLNGQSGTSTWDLNVYFKKSTDGKTIVWKADSVGKQLNRTDTKYYYVALG